MEDKIQKIRGEVERLMNELIQEKEKGFGSDADDACILELQNVLTYIDSMKKEPTISVWHDASERAENGRLYLYRTNQNIVDINRSEGKDFPDYCERWAYIDDLLKL